jgi:hypothetical protein
MEIPSFKVLISVSSWALTALASLSDFALDPLPSSCSRINRLAASEAEVACLMEASFCAIRVAWVVSKVTMRRMILY